MFGSTKKSLARMAAKLLQRYNGFAHFVDVGRSRPAFYMLPPGQGQGPLTFDLRDFTKITVPPEKVEGVVDQFVLSGRGEFGLQFGEVCAPFMDNNHFAIDDRLTGNIPGRQQ
jgi:hypothetical protein